MSWYNAYERIARVAYHDGAQEADTFRTVQKVLSLDTSDWTSYLGRGYYNVHTPSLIRVCVSDNPPWQSGTDQGKLRLLSIFQNFVSEIRGLPCANTGSGDLACAVVEAIRIASLCLRRGKQHATLCIERDIDDHILDVIRNRTRDMNMNILLFDRSLQAPESAIVLIQSPDARGRIKQDVGGSSNEDIIIIAITDPLASCLFPPLKCDIAVGSAQRLGLPLGGPSLAYMACAKRFGNMLKNQAVLLPEKNTYTVVNRTSDFDPGSAAVHMATLYVLYRGQEGLIKSARAIFGATAFLLIISRHLGYRLELSKEELKYGHHFGVVGLVCSKRRAAVLKRGFEENRINIEYDESSMERVICRIHVDEKIATSRYELYRIVNVLWIARRCRYEIAPIDMIKTLTKNLNDATSIVEGITTEPYETRPPDFFLKHRSGLRDHRLIEYMTQLIGGMTCSPDVPEMRPGLMSTASSVPELDTSSDMIKRADMHPLAPPWQCVGTYLIVAIMEKYTARLLHMDGCTFQPTRERVAQVAAIQAIQLYHSSRVDNDRPNTRSLCILDTDVPSAIKEAAIACGLYPIEYTIHSLQRLRQICLAHEADIAFFSWTYPSTCSDLNTSDSASRMVHEVGALTCIVANELPDHDVGADVCCVNLLKILNLSPDNIDSHVDDFAVEPVCTQKLLTKYLPSHSHLQKHRSLLNTLRYKIHCGPTHALTSIPVASTGLCAIPFLHFLRLRPSGLHTGFKEAIDNHLSTSPILAQKNDQISASNDESTDSTCQEEYGREEVNEW